MTVKIFALFGLTSCVLLSQGIVPIDMGRTSLLDIGIYDVRCQAFSGKETQFPAGWTGDDPETGTVYTLGHRQDDKDALLLHSPWKLGAGKTWVDYRLKLPKATPITLEFSIAMRHGCVSPTGSDGVTFAAFAFEPGEMPKQLHKEHVTSDAWKTLRFDLAKLAGKQCVVRLQVDPGPSKKPDFDFSYWGDPCIIAGDDITASPENQARELMKLPAIKATAKASLLPLNNTNRNGIVPGNILPCKNTLAQDKDGAWLFTYKAKDCKIAYRYQPRTGTLDDFTMTFNDEPPMRIAVGSGLELVKPATTHIIDCKRDGDSLNVTTRHEMEDDVLTAIWKFGIQGKALTIKADADKPLVKSLRLGTALAPIRKAFQTPYMGSGLMYLQANKLFTYRRLDWTKSDATKVGSDAQYHAKTDGTRNPLHEEGYIAFSPNPGEVLPNIPFEPSKYRALLGPKIILDIWGPRGGNFANDGKALRELKDHGIDHAGVIYHIWQRYGYDVKLPDHIPANPKLGGEEAMKALGQAAKDCGYLFALHENYIDLYPDAPSFDQKAIALNQDGSWMKAWYNEHTKVQSFVIRATEAIRFARQNSPEINKRYYTTMAYIDAQTCGSPDWRVDYDASQPMAAIARLKVKTECELYDYMRKVHGGPFLGEGNMHYFWAGPCDGVEAQTGGEDQDPFLDFNLLKVHPQMTNHGMGYYSRWHTQGRLCWGFDAGTPKRRDKYRAQEIAYGHAGFVGNPVVYNPDWVASEHHIMHAIQTQYGTAKVTAIDYEVDGMMVPAAVALPLGLLSRQRIMYDSGAVIWVNWNPEPWIVGKHAIAQWGVLCQAKDATIWTARQEGNTFTDYAECDEFVYADARTHFDMPYLINQKPLAEIKLKDCIYVGDGKIQISYSWEILDTPERPVNCFVHFVNPKGRSLDQLTFQNDHEVPGEWNNWKRGDQFVTGPFTLNLPKNHDYHDITIGLFDATNRKLLRGSHFDNLRYHIGRIVVNRDKDGNIVGISTLEPDQVKIDSKQKLLDFSERVTPSGTMVDFGKVATNGAVKIQKSNDGQLVIFTYPRKADITVKLNLKAWKLDGSQTLVAKAPVTQNDLGAVNFTIKGGWLTFSTGSLNSGRFILKSK